MTSVSGTTSVDDHPAPHLHITLFFSRSVRVSAEPLRRRRHGAERDGEE